MSHDANQALSTPPVVSVTGERADPFLRGIGLFKNFGHVRALQGVDVDVLQNEVLAIVGDNGAGKSTLTKILSGVFPPDHGDLYIGSKKVRLANPRQAHELGVSTVFQTLALVNCRNVPCNIFLGREPTHWRFFVDRQKMLVDAQAALADLGVHIPTLLGKSASCQVGSGNALPLPERPRSKAKSSLWMSQRPLWGSRSAGKVLDLILRLKSAGRGIVVISHNMHHVFSVADRIMVLRRGNLAGLRLKKDTTQDEVVAMIVGAA